MINHSPLSSKMWRQIAIRPNALSLCVFGSLVTLSGLSCFLGAFYDDEIFNLKWAALHFSNIFDYVRYINSHDIHPPASYLLNKLTFDILGNWKAVKFINGALNAAAIAWFHRQTVDKVATGERLILTFALATAATSEMWGTGLRWNAYFNPAFLILYTVALSERPSITTRAAILAVGTVFLFHTSYLTVVATPTLWGTFFVRSNRNLQPAVIARLALIVFLGMAACLPQLYVLITVHLPWHRGNLMGGAPYLYSFFYSIPQLLQTLTVGNAAFPVDYVPCIFLLLLAAAILSSVNKLFHDAYVVVLLSGVVCGLILLVVSGLGVEGRNAAFLYPISLTLIIIVISRSANWIRFPTMAVFALWQIISVYDFVLHRDTAKGSFNTPFAQAMTDISVLSKACAGKTYVFTFEPVLTYLIEDSGGRVSSPYASSSAETISMQENDCVLIVLTYRGVLPSDLYSKYTRPLNSTDFSEFKSINLGYDRFHTIKGHFGNEPFPKYYITIMAYNVLQKVSMPDWYHLIRTP